MNYKIALLSIIAVSCTVVSSQSSDLCRVAAICGDGRDFNEVTLNFTEIAGNNAGITNEVINQITDQISTQFQDTISTLQDQVSQMQEEQAKLYECPSQTYTGFMEPTDFIKHRGYFPKMTQFQMCGWIDYTDDGNSARTRTILSYAVGEEPVELLWQIRSANESSVKAGSNSFVFQHPLLSGNHFVCVGYDSDQTMSLSIDGSTVHRVSFVDQLVIPEGGALVLGKNHPNAVDSAENMETFGTGSIGNLMIWSRALTEAEIHETASSCNCPKDYVISFQHDQIERHGDTQYTVPQVCQRVVQSTTNDQDPIRQTVIVVV